MPGRRIDWVKKTARTRSDMVIRSDLPAWIIRALRDSGIKRLSTMAGMSDHELLEIPGIGRRSLVLIRAEITRFMEDGMTQAGSAAPPQNGEQAGQPAR
jgi:DNA-directed RNA polymerase alpha subunit